MRKADLEKYKTLLLKKRAELMREIEAVGDSHGSSTIHEATGDLSQYSYHMADQGTDQMDREMAFAYASKGGRLVYHIDEALRRIEKGTFGTCQKCEKAIQAGRLRNVPHARLCIECKEAEERKKRSGR